MIIAIGSDAKTHLTDSVIAILQACGHQLALFGALKADCALWPHVAYEVAKQVASGKADQGILFCWTGTGVSIVANKVPGVRAALCHDAETAKGARIWNDANILVMSLRSCAVEIAKEMLTVWFATAASTEKDDKLCLKIMQDLDAGKAI